VIVCNAGSCCWIQRNQTCVCIRHTAVITVIILLHHHRRTQALHSTASGPVWAAHRKNLYTVFGRWKPKELREWDRNSLKIALNEEIADLSDCCGNADHAFCRISSAVGQIVLLRRGLTRSVDLRDSNQQHLSGRDDSRARHAKRAGERELTSESRVMSHLSSPCACATGWHQEVKGGPGLVTICVSGIIFALIPFFGKRAYRTR
jgi:hypothetical protein